MTPKIDILIPVIEKDLPVLPHAIDSVRKHVKHPIADIVIVAPDSGKVKQVCSQKGCRFIDENTVLPITKKNINYRTSEWDRAGWLFQQLLKLSGDRICSQDHYLTLDADTLLIRPHIFKNNDKTVFYCRNTKLLEYFRTYRKLLGEKPTAPLSFVAHYMLFEKAKVKELKRKIELRNKDTWFTSIIQSINKACKVTFSEFETYGNYFYLRYPEQIMLKRALNLNLKRTDIHKIMSLDFKALAKNYRSVSFHSWNP